MIDLRPLEEVAEPGMRLTPTRQLGPWRLENIRPFFSVGAFLCPPEWVVLLRLHLLGFGRWFSLFQFRGGGLPGSYLLHDLAIELLTRLRTVEMNPGLRVPVLRPTPISERITTLNRNGSLLPSRIA